jgi:hypothetical protein
VRTASRWRAPATTASVRTAPPTAAAYGPMTCAEDVYMDARRVMFELIGCGAIIVIVAIVCAVLYFFVRFARFAWLEWVTAIS